MSNGKGDWPRKVDQKKYMSNWDRIFSKKEPDGETIDGALKGFLEQLEEIGLTLVGVEDSEEDDSEEDDDGC